MADTTTKLLLAFIVLLLAVQQGGIAENLLTPGQQTGSDDVKQAITDLRGIVSTSGNQEDLNAKVATNSELNDKLDESTFTAEDFAQESTLASLDSDFNSILGPNGETVDAFGTLVQKDAISLLSVPANHPYSPERLRVLVNGTRQFLMYHKDNNITQYNKEEDAHVLRPMQGENVTLESAESIPYIVHYENWYSWSLSINRSLQGGDVLRVGAFNDDNGYYLKQNGTDSELEATLVTRRGGETVREKRITLARPLTQFTRLELRSNWYNVGRQKWIQTTTNESRVKVQDNEVIGQTAPDGDRTEGPESPTLPLRWEIERGTGTPAIQVEAGSGAIMIAGSGEIITRVKVDRFDAEINQTGAWQPVAALRLDPRYDTIRGELTELDAAEISADIDGQVIVQSHDPRKVGTDTGEFPIPDSEWSRPALQSQENSVIQFTTNISKAPNETGTQVLNTMDPGGFQLGWGSIYSTGNKGAAAASARIARKRPLYGSDVQVFWARVDDEGNPSLPITLTTEYIVEMDY